MPFAPKKRKRGNNMPPKINVKKCNGCGECIKVCPVNCLELKGKKSVLARPKECIDCRACEVSCKFGAITF